MSLDLSKVEFIGPALPESFVKLDLEKILQQNNLLLKTSGQESKEIEHKWSLYRNRLRELGVNNGTIRVRNIVIEPLLDILGYNSLKESEQIQTREGKEDGGFILLSTDEKIKLRGWTVETDKDMEAPFKRGHAYRFSYIHISQRVLQTKQENVGIITDGLELRVLISDAARQGSQVIIKIQDDWRNSKEIPDSFKLLHALTSPEGKEFLPLLLDKARLKQTAITKELRLQAKQAILDFIQEIYTNPKNAQLLSDYKDKTVLAKNFWQEGLIIIYRLLFILKGEANDDPARSFGFAGSSIWRNTYSPTSSLSCFVRKILDEGIETNNYLEYGLKTIFKMFSEGLKSSELNIAPLGGALFGDDSTPLLSKLHWTEQGCAKLLDNLLWTSEGKRGSKARKRIHYGALDIEDLGRVYESLLELEPGISIEGMCRLRHSKIEVVIPSSQGEKYKKNNSTPFDDENDNVDLEEDENQNKNTTKIGWIEEIKPGQFYLRIGLGRKASGSYYTPHSFVKFLVEETLSSKIEKTSPKDDPYPNEILKIKVLDPAMGSGQFLVEACSFMAEKLYEACRFCDEKALVLEGKAENEIDLNKKNLLIEQANKWRDRILEIPDPNDEILYYLPSTAPGEYTESFSRSKALALCKRLTAVHCIYGIDVNPLAVELAKLSLWLESQSEGLPLTFLDHRLIAGDSVSGPFFENLQNYPISQKPMDDLLNQNLSNKIHSALFKAISEIKDLEKSIGIDMSDILYKIKSKERLDRILLPFKILAAAWSGSIMLGKDNADDFEYAKLANYVSENGNLPERIESEQIIAAICVGLGIMQNNLFLDDILQKVLNNEIVPSVSYDLEFPEVFFELKDDKLFQKGFDIILGNPPWDAVKPKAKEFYANYDFEVLAAPTKRERESIEKKLKENKEILILNEEYEESFSQQQRIHNILFKNQVTEVQGIKTGGDPDLAKLFLERFYQVCKVSGSIGVLVPSAFHANEGATAIRKLYLEKTNLELCYSFENKKKLFEIDSRFKFALIVATKNQTGTKEFPCAFYLHDEEWLFNKKDVLTYDLEFIKKSGGDYLSFIELRSLKDLDIAKHCFNKGQPFGDLINTFPAGKENCNKFYSIKFYGELHMTNDSWRFTPSEKLFPNKTDSRLNENLKNILKSKYLLLQEGKTFYHYNDLWGEPPNYIVAIEKLKDKEQIIRNTNYYRAVYRSVASSTNERTVIFTLIQPGVICGNSAPVESEIARPNSLIMLILGYVNSFVFDWCARQMISANVNQFILYRIPLALDRKFDKFLVHQVLRLICNHSGFKCLWTEQLGNNWQEKNKDILSWPVLPAGKERNYVLSSIDAVIAFSYHLNKDQYKHILNSFNRVSGENIYTDSCLEKFDELEKISVESFIKKYDPYWDIPINEDLPEPVIEIPIISENKDKLNLF